MPAIQKSRQTALALDLLQVYSEGPVTAPRIYQHLFDRRTDVGPLLNSFFYRIIDKTSARRLTDGLNDVLDLSGEQLSQLIDHRIRNRGKVHALIAMTRPPNRGVFGRQDACELRWMILRPQRIGELLESNRHLPTGIGSPLIAH